MNKNDDVFVVVNGEKNDLPFKKEFFDRSIKLYKLFTMAMEMDGVPFKEVEEVKNISDLITVSLSMMFSTMLTKVWSAYIEGLITEKEIPKDLLDLVTCGKEAKEQSK